MSNFRLTLAALVGILSLVTLAPSAHLGALPKSPPAGLCRSVMPSLEYQRGSLTVATDNPVSSPWFINNDPANGRGYESSLVYALAKVLDVARHAVTWVDEPFAASYGPGHKAFDFDVDEILYNPARARAVTFSRGYYQVRQSIVALKTSLIVSQHSPSELRNYEYGVQAGSPGLTLIRLNIKPRQPARVFATLGQEVAALESGRIDAMIIDTPTGQYLTSSQIMNSHNQLISTQVGQFPVGDEYYGLVLQKNNVLVGCLNNALKTLTVNGTLAALAKRWLGVYSRVPVLAP